MSYYSKQYTFEKVARHLMGMVEPSLSEDGCAYRGKGGARCAVGCLIPDNLYSPDMEGFIVKIAEPRTSNDVLVELIGHDLELCADLQLVHDRLFSERDFALLCVADKHGLRIPDWL